MAAALPKDGAVMVVDSLDAATHAHLWVRPTMSLLNDKAGEKLSIALDHHTGIDAARIIEIEQTVPTILAVNFINPWLLDEIAPGAAAVIGTFGALTEALVDLVSGRTEPQGKLPYTIPADAAAVERKAADIPGSLEPVGYAYRDDAGADYVFGFGLDRF